MSHVGMADVSHPSNGHALERCGYEGMHTEAELPCTHKQHGSPRCQLPSSTEETFHSGARIKLARTFGPDREHSSFESLWHSLPTPVAVTARNREGPGRYIFSHRRPR